MKMAICIPTPIKHIMKVKENKLIAIENEIHLSFHRMGVFVQQLLNIGILCDVKYCPVHETSIVDTMSIAIEGIILARKLKKVSSFTYLLTES